MTFNIPEITVADLLAKTQSNASFFLLDIREDFEVAICALDHHYHIPMGQLPMRLEELPNDQEIIIYCHHGTRSAQMTAFLNLKGFDKVFNLKGGIDQWAIEIDQNIPQY